GHGEHDAEQRGGAEGIGKDRPGHGRGTVQISPGHAQADRDQAAPPERQEGHEPASAALLQGVPVEPRERGEPDSDETGSPGLRRSPAGGSAPDFWYQPEAEDAKQSTNADGDQG